MSGIDVSIGCYNAEKLNSIIFEADEIEKELLLLRDEIKEIAERENLIWVEVNALSPKNQEDALELMRKEGGIEITVPFHFGLLFILPLGSKVVQQETKFIESEVENKKVIELPKGQKIVAKEFSSNKILNYIKFY